MDQDQNPSRPGITRRAALVTIGGVTGGALLASSAAGALSLPGLNPDSTVMLRRPQDFLRLTLNLHNLAISSSANGPVLAPAYPNLPSYLVIDFGPQGHVENWYPAPDQLPPGTTYPASVPSRITESSRLAFDVTGMPPISYTIEAILDWLNLPPSLVPIARNQSGPVRVTPTMRAPLATETAIEIPWRMQLSPHEGVSWAHATEATPTNGWYALWHTRLAGRGNPDNPTVTETNGAEYPIHSMWDRDAAFPLWVLLNTAPGTSTSLDDTLAVPVPARNRYEITRLTSDYTFFADGAVVPAQANRLMLSSLGGWLDLQGTWSKSAKSVYNTSAWQHRTVLGRDAHVLIATKGFLYPFGHRATRIDVYTRTLRQANGNGPRAAYVTQETYLIINEPTKSYSIGPHGTNKFGQPANPLAFAFPFTSVTITTKRTTDLSHQQFAGGGATAFLDPATQAPYEFHLQGVDYAGQGVVFDVPLLFITGDDAIKAPVVTAVTNAWNATLATPDATNTATFRTAKVVVGIDPNKPGSTETAVTIKTARFGSVTVPGNIATTVAAGLPPFLPYMYDADVDLPEIRALAGKGGSTSRFQYYSDYAAFGFTSANKGRVFLETLAGAGPQPLSFATDHSGGLATPNVGVHGMSALSGPITDKPANAAHQTYDLGSIFNAIDAKILGGISLVDILSSVLGADGTNAQQALAITSGPDGTGADVTKLTWTPALQASDDGTFVPDDQPNPGALTINATARTVPAGTSTFSVTGELVNFAVNLFGNSGDTYVIGIHATRLAFTSGAGGKPNVDCKIDDVSFHGALEFVAELATICSFGDGSGLAINPFGDHISIELKIGLPDLSFGVFTLSNIKIFAGLVIPYDGSPVRFQFAFCAREDPFVLRIWIFGGGGFVGITLGGDGIELLEFSFDFGVGLSLDIGVASGSVEAVGGMYFALATTDDNGTKTQNIELTSFLKLDGALEVLGLVKLSLEFYLALSYYSGPDRLYGEAKMTVAVEVLIFSGSVDLDVKRQIAKSGGNANDVPSNAIRSRTRSDLTESETAVAATAFADDPGACGPDVDPNAGPRFSDVLTDQQWTNYCAAFAPAGV